MNNIAVLTNSNYYPNSGLPVATVAVVILAGLLLASYLWKRRNQRLSRPGMWVRIVNFISRRALAKKAAASPSAEAIMPPRLVRNADAKTITITMSCPEGSYGEDMAWFCPKAKLAGGIIGYMLRNDPRNGHIVLESIGKQSDAFVQQLAAVSLSFKEKDAEVLLQTLSASAKI